LMLPPAGADPAAVFSTERSGAVTTAPLLALLLTADGSAVAADTAAVLVIVLPDVAAMSMLITIVNVAELPFASVAIVQLTVPVPPAAGVVHTKAGPLVCAKDANLAFTGTRSLRITVCASLGPEFATVIVYVAVPPRTAFAGPVLVTPRSAAVLIVVDAVDVLFAALASGDVLVTVAVLLTLPAAALDGVRTVRVKLAVAAWISVGMLQVTVPLAPTAGVVQVNAGPLVCDSETNVTVAGRTSVSDTPVASAVPMLETVIV
jgi:hypothetical protein